MSPNEYREKYGGELKAHENQPWFAALIEVLTSAHPLHDLKSKKDGDRLAGATMFLAEIKGYQDCLDIITLVCTPADLEEKEPANSYIDEEIPIPE